MSWPRAVAVVTLAAVVASCADDTTSPGPPTPPARHIWSGGYGDSSGQTGNAIATDAARNTIITGHFSGPIDFGGGTLTSAGVIDIFIAKFDSEGKHVWSQRFGGADFEEAVALAVDTQGNIIITGWFRNIVDFGGGPLTSAGNIDVFVAKFSPSGTHVWSARYGDNFTEEAFGVATDLAGNIIIVGQFAGSVDFGGGPLTSAGANDIFVVKLAGNGSHIWSRRFGDTDTQEACDITAIAPGDIAITGAFLGSVDFGGGVITSAGARDIFVARLDADGNHVWSGGFGDAAPQWGRAVALDPAGNVALAGDFEGTVDFGGTPLSGGGQADAFVVRFAPDGTHVWSKGFGDAEFQEARGVAIDNTGQVIVGGAFWGTVDLGGGAFTSAGRDDLFLAKFTSGGTHIWSRQYGDANAARSFDIATDSGRNIVMTGVFSGDLDFGGGTVASGGSNDVFVAKIGP